MNKRVISLITLATVFGFASQAAAREDNDPTVEIVNKTNQTVTWLRIKTQSPLGRGMLKFKNLKPGASLETTFVFKRGHKQDKERAVAGFTKIGVILADKCTNPECPHKKRLCKNNHDNAKVKFATPWLPERIEIVKRGDKVAINLPDLETLSLNN